MLEAQQALTVMRLVSSQEKAAQVRPLGSKQTLLTPKTDLWQ